MDTRRKLLWTLTVALTGLTTVVLAQDSGYTPANVPIREVAAKVGYTANFTCESYGAPLVTCLWERKASGDRSPLLITFTPDNAREGQPSFVPGYSYTGAGFDRGSCGIVVSIVKDSDNANWDCTLISQNKGNFRGTVHVNILKKPTAPQFFPGVEILRNLPDLENPRFPGGRQGQPVDTTVTCGSANGQPAPTFRWFIGDRELSRQDGLQSYETFNDTKTGNIVTAQSLKGYRYTWRDNGKLLRCIVEHEGLTGNEPRETAQIIGIQFAPKAENYDPSVFVPALGEAATIALNVSAHPRPDISWRVGDDILHPGGSPSKNGRYRALKVEEFDAEPGVFECKLVIDPVEAEDLEREFVLLARNDNGNNEFALRISSSSASSAGIGAGGIIGLVLGIPALLIIIAVILVYTRARGLLCFKGDDGTASEKERMDDETPQVEEKPAAAVRLTTRLSAIYENFMAKKKDKTAPADEEAVKAQEKESGEVTSPSASDEKKPEDIVYAELDLTLDAGNGKPQVVVRCPDDKTEYAEIVGVVPAAVQSVDETTKKDKSPTGSNNPSPKK